MINFDDHMLHRMNARRMGRDGLPVSVGTVNNVLARTGRNMKPVVEAMIPVMQRAGVLHIDETSFKLNWKLVWVWIFLDPPDGQLAVRGAPEQGVRRAARIQGSDRLRRVEVVQRVAAPALLGAHPARGQVPAPGAPRQRGRADILERLRGIYGTARDASEKHMKKAMRARVRTALLGCARRLIDDHWGSAVSRPFLVKLEGAADDLFAFVLDPRVQPTNNAAERGLREIVVHRKIRGSLRAEESMEIYGNIFTCIVTWKNQSLDYAEELLPYA